MFDLKKFRKDRGIKQADLCKDLGIDQPYLSQIERGIRPLNHSKINILRDKYGEDIFKYEQNISIDANIIQDSSPPVYKNENGRGVPYFDIDISATITESFNDVKELPEFYVDFRPFNDCAAYLPIWGDSMYPTFASGEIIAVKKLINKDIILWGEAHLIITNEVANNMKTIKLLYPHDEPDKIILRASNPNFKGDTVIPKSSILSIYIVKGKITRKQF